MTTITACGICGSTRRLKKIGPFWFCRDHQVDYSASASVLATQLEHAHQHIANLKATLTLWENTPSIHTTVTELKAMGRRDESDWGLLRRLVAALLLAQIAENAQSSSPLTDMPTTALRDTERPTPGQSTHPARKRANELRQSIRQALDVWDQAVDNRFAPTPRPDDGIPKVRCRVNDCPARDVWVKAWFKVRGRKQPVYRERCASCGTHYQPLEQEEAS